MPYYIEYESDGRISRSGRCQDEVIPWLKAHTEDTLVEVELGQIPADLDKAYFDEALGSVVAMPPQPSPHHFFDYPARVWAFDDAKAWAAVRAERNRRIAATDKVFLPDRPLTPERRAAYEAYRQALRDITEQPDPTAITWPELSLPT